MTFNDASEADLAWSPDGMRIAFKSHRDGNDEIYVMAADGSRQVNLTRNPASDSGPSFTPDGKHLFFASNRDGNRELYRMRSDGTAVERLTNHPAADHSPGVSPDGGRIAFISDRDGNDEVYVLRLDSSAVRRLTDSPLSDWSPTWSTDGEALIVTRGDRNTDRRALVRVSLHDERTEILFEGNDSGNASWRRSDGAVVFGTTVRNEQGEPGPGRIQIALPGGAGRQPADRSPRGHLRRMTAPRGRFALSDMKDSAHVHYCAAAALLLTAACSENDASNTQRAMHPPIRRPMQTPTRPGRRTAAGSRSTPIGAATMKYLSPVLKRARCAR